MYFKNPAGRIVAIDDPEQIAIYENKPGFSHITPQEEYEYCSKRAEMVAVMKIKAERAAKADTTGRGTGDGLYMATVSQNMKSDGYGVASACVIDELNKLGLETRTFYNGQRVAMLFHNPYSITHLRSDYRVIYTMFESDKIPDEWAPYLNEADMLIVPSRWCADVFKRAGFEAKVVPLGYDDTAYFYRPRINKRKNRQTFNFLHYNAFNIRKGFPEVFKAFTQEFKRDEPVRLILKTTQRESQIPSPFRGLEANYPNIKIIAGHIPSDDMQRLLTESDCFVFPSRGEGFGMTPLEAMATGMPAIVPNAHGISEYFNPEYMYEVKVEAKCPALYTRYKGIDVGKMVICSVEDLRRQMRWVYEHQDECIAKGQKASEYARNWTLRKTAAMLKDIVAELQSRPPRDRKLGDVLNLERIT